MPESEEVLAINEVQWLLDDIINGAAIDEIDRKRGLSAADRMADSWRPVRKYWRLASLKDLQGTRDDFLRILKKWPGYFWGERDLAFIFQSLGGFFLDVGLEQARLKAVADGKHEDGLEDEARRIYLGDDFQPWEKTESKRNYAVALDYNLKFVQSHRRFEELRMSARDAANYDDMNENPFLVDLVQRYHNTMDDLIAKERNMRASMILEAAALCVDPLFQVNDIKQAILLANSIQGLAPNNPIHHFVRATAYYTDHNYEEALASYNAFLKASSIMTDARQRDISRARRAECEQRLRNKPPAGGAGGDG
jgi:tetratricopeptide (TPR) repeat protein